MKIDFQHMVSSLQPGGKGRHDRQPCSSHTAASTVASSPSHVSYSCFLSKERENATFNVTFSKAEITLFPMELGDNPSCEGVPIQLSREPCHSRVVDIDTLEEWKRKNRGDRVNDPSAFKLHFFQRQRLLKNMGYTFQELAEVSKETESIRRKRLRSVRLLRLRLRFISFFTCKHRHEVFGGLLQRIRSQPN